jgi:CheY-like chemotaxis protein
MNHEMRTPMNVINGLTSLMLEKMNPANISETLKKVHVAGKTLMGLINDVLDISKVDAGKLELIPIKYDTAGLLDDIITINRERIANKPITFTPEINDELPASLFGDSLRVKQIINNLLSNALKFTKEGTVTLAVVAENMPAVDGDANNDADTEHEKTVLLTFTVSDTGIGMSEADIANLFTNYNQADTSASREADGAGFGLTITKKLVDLMGGEITAESELGKGSTFRVRICQGLVGATAIGGETAENLRTFRYAEKKKQAQATQMRPDLSYARVLVVDDFPVNLDIAAGMLRKFKLTVDCVTSGQDAFNLISTGTPVYDAIFMDHMMPGMDGVETTAAIRMLDADYAKNIPIIALTANDAPGSEQMFLNNGFNAYLSKPYTMTGLDSVVQKWVRDRSRE